MTHGSLFSGIGGFDLAAERMGWTNVFHCEINQFGQKILKYYWPNSISYEDITKTDFSIHRGTIDVLTGGFPCQPYSLAGLRKGDEDERHLWPEMLRAIREVQPSWIVGENVRGIVSWNAGVVFEEVQTDLEAEGYEVQSFILPAAGVEAPHIRDRTWFVAYSASYRRKRERQKSKEKNREQRLLKNRKLEGGFKRLCLSQPITYTKSLRRCERNSTQTFYCRWTDSKYITKRANIWRGIETISGTRISSYTQGVRKRRLCITCKEVRTRKSNVLFRGEHRMAAFRQNIGNTHISRCRKLYISSIPVEQGLNRRCNNENARTNITNSHSFRQREEVNRNRKSRFFDKESQVDYWGNFPTQSPICSGDDGISPQLDGIAFSAWRNNSIEGYGNAIVPALVLRIFKAIELSNQNKF